MKAKRVFGVLVCGGVVAGGLAGSTKSDPDKLAQVGQVVGSKVKGALPDSSTVSGPLVAFRPGDALPVEEKVRMRIRTDKTMDGADVTVAAGSAPGEVKLRGVVRDLDQAQRAVRLAEGTVGVEKVVNELAVPER